MRKKTPNVMGELLGDAPKNQNKTTTATPKTSPANTKTKVAASKSSTRSERENETVSKNSDSKKKSTASENTKLVQASQVVEIPLNTPIDESVEQVRNVVVEKPQTLIQAESSAEEIIIVNEEDNADESVSVIEKEITVESKVLDNLSSNRNQANQKITNQSNEGFQIVKQMPQGIDFDDTKQAAMIADNPDELSDQDNNSANSNILRIGIDFGTENTAMVSERGDQTNFPSYVGYIRDILGKKLLENGMAIGESALEHQSFLNVYQPMENGVIKNNSEMYSKAARDILQHVVDQANPTSDDKVCAIIGVPARASSADKENMLRMAKEIVDIALVVPDPYLIGYYEGRLSDSIIVDIGADTIGFCMMNGNAPTREDQLMSIGAGNFVDSVLLNLINESYPEVQVSKRQIKEIKEKYAYVGESEKEILVTFRAAGLPKKYEITNEVRIACETLINPIVEYIAMLLLKFPSESHESVLQNIYLAGGGSKIKNLDLAIQHHLSKYGDVKVNLVSEPENSTCKGALRLAMDVPLDQWTLVGEMIV